MLVPSSNDAAQTLARFIGGDEDKFVNMMNDKAKVLGLADTNFSNPVGLDSADNYSTALDLSKITQEFLKYSLLSDIVNTKAEDVTSIDGTIIHHLHTSNKLLLENPEVVGVKTGFTTEAQGNLIVKINHNGAEVLTIVLNTPNREDDTQKLIDWIFRAYRW
jgi:D-alanyl-D-alanine carboxypeptidase (penicillin-binding protein 5/6)